FQAEDGIRDFHVTGVQTCALPIFRQALGMLESEGLISRFRAKGTFVNKRPQDLFWLAVETDWNGLLAKREGVRIEILSDRKGERSEERRVGKESRSGWARGHEKKK